MREYEISDHTFRDIFVASLIWFLLMLGLGLHLRKKYTCPIVLDDEMCTFLREKDESY